MQASQDRSNGGDKEISGDGGGYTGAEDSDSRNKGFKGRYLELRIMLNFYSISFSSKGNLFAIFFNVNLYTSKIILSLKMTYRLTLNYMTLSRNYIMRIS